MTSTTNTASFSKGPAASSFFNLGAILLAGIPFLTLLFSDHLGLVGLKPCLGGLALVGILFYGPDVLAGRPGAKWWESIEVWSVVLLLLCALAGPWLGKLSGMGYPLVLLLGLGAVMAIKNLSIKSPGRWWSLAGLAIILLCVFVYLSLYGKGYHKWFYTESAVLCSGVLDTYYHAAISESIHSLGVASTSIDGSPYIHYHWLSHWLLGGLARGIGVDSFSFYHLFYPMLFVPLGLKIMYLFTRRFVGFQPVGKLIFPVLFTVGMVLLYALPVQPLNGIQPFLGESQLMAWILVMAHAAFLISAFEREREKQRSWNILLLVSFGFGLAISFTKISTGFVWLGALSPLFLLRVPWKKWLWSVPLFMVIPLLVLKYVLILDRGIVSVSIVDRVNNLFGASDQLLFLFWVPLLLIVLGPSKMWPSRAKTLSYFQEWSKIDHAPLLVLGTAWGLGLLGAVAGSSWRPDVMYFLLPALLLSLPLWLKILIQSLNRYGRGSGVLVALLLAGFAVVSTPRLVGGLLLARQELAAVKAGGQNVAPRQAFIRELGVMRKTGDAGTMVAIPSGESWFWHQGPHELASSFLVPAVAGRAMLAGLSEELLAGNYQYYSVADYRKKPHLPLAEPENLVSEMKAFGGKRLLVFSWREGTMITDEYD